MRILTLLVFCACAAFAEVKGRIVLIGTPTPFVQGSPTFDNLNVFLDAVPPVSAHPELSKNWQVTAQFQDGTVKPLPVDDSIHTNRLPRWHYVTLHLKEPVDPSNVTSLTVQFDGVLSSLTLARRDKDDSDSFKPANSSKDADIYISGSVNPAVGSKPTYSIDSKAHVLFRGSDVAAGFGISAAVKTDNRPRADPDSFNVKALYERPPLEMGGLGYRMAIAGLEFDRKAKVLNFIAAPQVSWYFRRSLHGAPAHEGESGPVVAVFELDSYAGLELGANLKNEYSVENGPGKGSGGIFRGVPGTAAIVRLNRVGPFKSVDFVSAYEVRLLARPELILETRKDQLASRGVATDKPLPLLSRQARHHWTNTIGLNVTDAFGFSVQHEYGSLPPTFTFVDHKLQIGLVYKIKQNSALRF